MVHLHLLASFLGDERALAKVSVDVLCEFLDDVVVDERIDIYIFGITCGLRIILRLQCFLKGVEKSFDVSKLLCSRLLRIAEHHWHSHRCPPAGGLILLLLYLEVVASCNCFTFVVILPYKGYVHTVRRDLLVLAKSVYTLIAAVKVHLYAAHTRRPAEAAYLRQLHSHDVADKGSVGIVGKQCPFLVRRHSQKRSL